MMLVQRKLRQPGQRRNSFYICSLDGPQSNHNRTKIFLRLGILTLHQLCVFSYLMYTIQHSTDTICLSEIFRKNVTSCNIEGSTPPSDSLPHPVTVAFSPTSKSSDPGKHMGDMCGANCSVFSSFTKAKSYSQVKKLYLGWTALRATPCSTKGYCSDTDEKSYSPTRIRIWDVKRL